MKIRNTKIMYLTLDDHHSGFKFSSPETRTSVIRESKPEFCFLSRLAAAYVARSAALILDCSFLMALWTL